MPIVLQNFAGEVPRIEPRYLPPTAAEVTSNVTLARGSLAPTRNPHTWETLPGARGAVYLFNGSWMSWTDPTTRVVPGPVQTDRLYITSDNAKPKLWVGGITYDLALKAPAPAPALTRTGTLDPELTEKILYAYTFVSSLGEESPPSPLSSPISWSPGCAITIGSMATAPVGSRITKKRIYRSQTSESGVTDLYFVAEVNASDVAYVHDLEAAPLQEVLPSADYDPPPDSMTGLIALPNGIMAAFTGKELLFSEPWQPHAWPTKYRLAVTERIVALAAFGSSVAVLTQGTPYVVQGLHPDSMAMERMESGLPCVSARSVVDLGFDAIYASTEGLVRITAQGAQVLSKALWTADQWNAINPSSIIASAHNGRYVMAHTPVDDPGPTTLVIDTTGETPFLTHFSDAPIAFHLHQPTGRLFYIGADQVSVQQFDPPNRILRDYAWKSRPFFSPVPVAFGAVMIDATDVRIGTEVRVYADGTLKHTITALNRVERLPSGAHSLWQIEVIGKSTITRIALGQTPAEVVQ